jgi:hypothetical protein
MRRSRGHDSAMTTSIPWDFVGDGKADILWRNSSGALYEWWLNGISVIGGGSLSSATIDWQIAGAGDFNGDGKSDILWRDDSGVVRLWEMNGFLGTGSGVVQTADGTVTNDWHIVGHHFDLV